MDKKLKRFGLKVLGNGLATAGLTTLLFNVSNYDISKDISTIWSYIYKSDKINEVVVNEIPSQVEFEEKIEHSERKDEPLSFELSPFYQRRVKQKVEDILEIPKWGGRTFDFDEYKKRRTKFFSFEPYAREAGRHVNKNLVEAHALVESKGDPLAVSPKEYDTKEYAGILQFKKETAKRNGAKINVGIDERFDPEVILTKIYPNYIKEIVGDYKKEGIKNPLLEQVLYTYITGRFIDKVGEDFCRIAPKVVDDYVVEIGALEYLIENDLLPYDVSPIYLPKEIIGTHSIKKNETFYEISKKYGKNVNDILMANQEVDPKKVPIGYKIKIPK